MATRREFVSTAAFAGAGLLVQAQTPQSQSTQAAPNGNANAKPKPPALDQAIVKEYVIAGHVDLDKVKKMLAEEPGLLNATWDWGGGDFEMAIGGAGHAFLVRCGLRGGRQQSCQQYDTGGRRPHPPGHGRYG